MCKKRDNTPSQRVDDTSEDSILLRLPFLVPFDRLSSELFLKLDLAEVFDKSFDDFWVGLNKVCGAQYSVIAEHCSQLSIRVRKFRDFAEAHETGSLNVNVVAPAKGLRARASRLLPRFLAGCEGSPCLAQA